MIRVNVKRDKLGFIWGYSVKGHANYAQEGSDIVCSAVSAVSYTGIGALQEILGIESYKTAKGYMDCVIPVDIAEEKKDKVKIILETIVIGFKQIENSYRKYLTVQDEEV